MADSPAKQHGGGPSAAATTVSCVLAVDGGERLARDWQALAAGYISAILRQLVNIHPGADVQVAPMVIYSLPPVSKRPLVVRPFRPVAQAIAELPGLLGGKGKQRESTSDQDYALLEGLVVAASLLEAQAATYSYIVLVSAQDIPNTNFWDEEVPGSLPFATLWPDIGPSVGWPKEEFETSQAWQKLIHELTRTRTHLCTICTRFLPRLEELQRKAAYAKNVFSQALPNLQHPEHAILLSGFHSGPPSNKRSHADSVDTPRADNKDLQPPTANGGLGNKRVKLSPRSDNASLGSDQVKAVKPETPTTVSPANEAGQGAYARQPHMPVPATSTAAFSDATQQASPTKILMALANPQSGAQPLDPSAVFQPQAQQIQELAQQAFSVQDIQQKREEVKTQMKAFMTSLSAMAKSRQLSIDQARHTAEQVRAEAVKKLQLLDMLEHQSANKSPGLGGMFGAQPSLDGGFQRSPSLSTQVLQNQTPQGSSVGSTNFSPPQQASQNAQYQQYNAQQQTQQPVHPGHNRTTSFSSSNTPLSSSQQTPAQMLAQLQASTSNTPQQASQPLPTPQIKHTPDKGPGSPAKIPSVWTGALQWSLVDPQTKQKRNLAFFVDAVPMRSNAAVELMNLDWPEKLEIAHISVMPMSELQKYATDNRVQVLQFQRASAGFVESQGMSTGQNDSLYKLLAKSLEDKSSVATIKLSSPNRDRGIVVVALPGQSKLVGLLFLHTTLPPRTPALPQQSDQMQQQQQQATRHQRVSSITSDNGSNPNQGLSQYQRAPQLQPQAQMQHQFQLSPSLANQSLQPMMQQYTQLPASMQSNLSQHSTPPQNAMSAFNSQMAPNLNSPNMRNAAQVPTSAFAGMANATQASQPQVPPGTFNFNFQMPTSTNNGNSSQPPAAGGTMSDAQFQEMLASLQKG